MKNTFLSKEYDKFKASLTESVKSAMAVKQSYFTASENAIASMETSKIMQRSRFIRSQTNIGDVSFNLAAGSEIKLG
jgi:hypothetical protein